MAVKFRGKPMLFQRARALYEEELQLEVDLEEVVAKILCLKKPNDLAINTYDTDGEGFLSFRWYRRDGSPDAQQCHPSATQLNAIAEATGFKHVVITEVEL